MQKKKKIAFVLTTFVVGGVEKSFLELLDSIDRDKYEITVFLPDSKGEWTQQLVDRCEVRYLRIQDFNTIIRAQMSKMSFFSAFRSLFFRILAKLNYRRHYRKSTEYFIRSMPREKERFDCVIAYQIINDDCVLGSLYRLKASKKVAWSHAYIHKEEKIYGQWYNKFDKLFCVSDFAKKALDQNFPTLTNKTEVFHNCVNLDRIIQLSKEMPQWDLREGDIAIVTVGRLSQEKGQIIIPSTVRKLLDLGYNVSWYLIGDGNLREEIVREIQKENVEDHVILMGNKDNPYPYIKACDIYVQTSLVEGWGLTVNEAKVLHKPIVTTEAGVMSEQIQNGHNGIIISENTPEKLAKEIGRLIEFPELRAEFVGQLKREDLYWKNEIEKLYAVIEG